VLKVRGSSVIANKKSVEKPVPSRRKAMEERFYQPRKSAQPGVVLVFIRGPMQGRQFTVEKAIFRIGANPENDLVISSDDHVSGKHACLRYDKGDLLLADQHSKNGTFLNNRRLTNVPLLINVGDQIRVGNSTFQVAQSRYQRV
ncbi:MAG: FHA domain-containing protein, partial [Pyrinomonadaceae bacterium]